MALLDTIPRLVDSGLYSDVVYFGSKDTLGSIATPGKATVTTAFERKLDIREPTYGNGATVVAQGTALRKAEILVEMFQGQHLVDWQLLCRLVLFKPPGLFAVTVSHPILSQIGLTACIVESVSGLEIDEYGGFSSTIKIVEFAPVRQALPSVAKAAVPAVIKPTPTSQDAADLEIAKLMAQVAARAAK